MIGGIIAGIQAQLPALVNMMQGTVRPALQGVSTNSTRITSNQSISIDARGAQQGVGAEIRRAIDDALRGRTGRAETIRRMS